MTGYSKHGNTLPGQKTEFGSRRLDDSRCTVIEE
jgi:hypothetical protein